MAVGVGPLLLHAVAPVLLAVVAFSALDNYVMRSLAAFEGVGITRADAGGRRLFLHNCDNTSRSSSACMDYYEVKMRVPENIQAGYHATCDTESPEFDIRNSNERVFQNFSPVAPLRILWYIVKLLLVFLAAPSFPLTDIKDWQVENEKEEDWVDVVEHYAKVTKTEFVSSFRNFGHEDIQNIDVAQVQALFDFIVDAKPPAAQPVVQDASPLMSWWSTRSPSEALEQEMTWTDFRRIEVSPREITVQGRKWEDYQADGLDDKSKKRVLAALRALGAECLEDYKFRPWHWRALLISAGKTKDAHCQDHMSLQDLLYKTENPDDKQKKSSFRLYHVVARSEVSILNPIDVRTYFESTMFASPVMNILGIKKAFTLPWSNRVQLVLFVGQAIQGVIEAVCIAWYIPPHVSLFMSNFTEWFLLSFRLEVALPTVYNICRVLLIFRKLFRLVAPDQDDLGYLYQSLGAAICQQGLFFRMIQFMFLCQTIVILPMIPKCAPLILPGGLCALLAFCRLNVFLYGSVTTLAIGILLAVASLVGQHLLVQPIETLIYEQQGRVRPYLCTFSKLDLIPRLPSLNCEQLIEVMSNPEAVGPYFLILMTGILLGFVLVAVVHLCSQCRRQSQSKLGSLNRILLPAVYQAWLFRSKGVLEAIEGKNCVERKLKLFWEKVMVDLDKDSPGDPAHANDGRALPRR